MPLINDYGAFLLSGLAVTLALAAVSGVLAFCLGLGLVLLRMTRIRILQGLVAAFVEFQRNVPPLVHIFLWYFGVSSALPQALQDLANANHGEFWFACLAIGLYYAAYVAEHIRSGMRSISGGQMEAARALGLSHAGAMRRVMLPQALRASIPPLTSEAVMLVKTTGLAMVLGVMELTYAVKDVASKSFRTFESYGIGTALYVAVALVLLYTGSRLGRRLRIKGR
ncbi:amino acid ABC transporter permease [Achromobacter sp. Marseille-Q0513]|uniref:amino acid ABC transporter permease n=1 Tax=Achromobacter sp. Marseille-Q0513 TaxID=2829161 RepID=UPI001B92C47F|nr:amino acid ABC transporter permease [Achromobacter sp. Marseille-Q0513]MBR8655454.1 amino acid ABC transporter permease [Achromobacter sp. Marseille-Q0513]